MFCSCGIGLFQKIHQASNYKLELKGFLTTAFIVVAVLSLIISLIMGRKNAFSVILNQNKKINVKPIITMIIVGATTGVVHRLNLYLAGAIPSAIFFPVVNGGSIILCTIAAFIIFKEKLQKLQWIGLIVGVVALAFLCFRF
jgi:drug/metabolite transporter (DMT)-like permease